MSSFDGVLQSTLTAPGAKVEIVRVSLRRGLRVKPSNWSGASWDAGQGQKPPDDVQIAVTISEGGFLLSVGTLARTADGQVVPDERRIEVPRRSSNCPNSQASCLDYDELVDFDKSIGGAGLAWVQRREDDPFEPYEIVDRDVFRPLQYCEAYFQMDPDDAEWLTRALVEMSCAHIEALLKRIAGLPLVPYGSALFNWAVRRRLATQTFEHLKRFGIIYSSAKHDFNHAASTHRFSMPDAVLAYVIARRLATELYALANLRTSLDS